MLTIMSWCWARSSSPSSQMKVARRLDEKCSQSRLTAVQSAWVVTAQNPGPSRSSCHQTGACCRRKVNQ